MKFISTIFIIIILALLICTPNTALNNLKNGYNPINNGNDGPNVIINFAGNLSDLGGPYWRPPGEWDKLDEENEGIWRNGYYTNDSRQQEDWIYINLSVIDDDGVAQVWLHWLNGTIWVNGSYQFINTKGDYWEFNSSGNISTIEGYDYSFDILAIDSFENYNIAEWKKIGMGGGYTRRSVQLNCTPESVTYRPLYWIQMNESYHDPEDNFNHDRLHHDQGTDGTPHDIGYLRMFLPGDDIEWVYCSAFYDHWFDENICIEPFTLKNIYYHFWWTSKVYGAELYVTARHSRDNVSFPLNTHSQYSTTAYNALSTIIWDNGNSFYSNTYKLEAHLLDVSSEGRIKYTDNNIFELGIPILLGGGYPQSICNRSIVSYIILNVPDDETLNTSYYDTDNDYLSDWTELYVIYTSPFLSDTDNDGATDYEEVNGASYGYWNSDPNNYANTTDFRCTTEVKIVSPEKALYIFNKKIHPLFRIPIIIGHIEINAEISGCAEIDRVEFFIDNKLMETDSTFPFTWIWDDIMFFRHNIEVVAYDNACNYVSDEIGVWKFF